MAVVTVAINGPNIFLMYNHMLRILSGHCRIWILFKRASKTTGKALCMARVAKRRQGSWLGQRKRVFSRYSHNWEHVFLDIIFKWYFCVQVPEGNDGKVGVTGSGKGLTSYAKQGKHQFQIDEWECLEEVEAVALFSERGFGKYYVFQYFNVSQIKICGYVKYHIYYVFE